jgi:hypothetical protein
MFKKCKFTTSDDGQEFDGYTDDTTFDEWDNIIMTRQQLTDFVSCYDVRFLEAGQGWNDNDYPIAVIYWDDKEETLESSPFVVDSEVMEGYYLPGEYMVIE